MSNKLSWRDALKQFNDDRIKEGGKYSIPKKGTPEYASVRKLMGDDIDAVELKPNQTITGQDPPAPVKQSRAKSRTPPKEKPADAPNKEKPQWVDEPKPVAKMADEAPVTQSRAKSRTPPKEKPADVSKDKPLWVDEPKPVPKNPKEKEQPPTKMADEAPVAAGLKNKKSKKKSVATQTSAPEPSSPKSEDSIVKLK